MPRSRVTEMPQHLSPRGQPNNLRTSSSDSDPLHHRSKTERNPKLSEGRSPRGFSSEPVNQKKLGTRIADLESQLGQAQTELKSLKNQLSSAEVAKKAAQDQLDKKSKKNQKLVPLEPIESKEMNKKENIPYEISDDFMKKETDVFEVPVNPKNEPEPHSPMTEQENPLSDDMVVKNDEINLLKSKLDEKEKEMKAFCLENESFKSQLNEKSIKLSLAETEIQELTTKLSKADLELEKSRFNAVEINERLEATEKVKVELENEMRMLRVQTEQWRKAADAAASVLASGVGTNGRRISERCGSMDKHYVNGFEYGVGYFGSPGFGDDSDDGIGSGKRKGSGMKMFGDLWKKKGHK